MVQYFNEVEKKLDELIKMYTSYSIYKRDGRDFSQNVQNEADRIGIKPGKESIQFVNKHDEYVRCRIIDMESDTEKIELHEEISEKEYPTIKDLNFECATIGSDETGAGEIFKPMVVAAVRLDNREQVESCIKLGVTDSKNYNSNHERVYKIAEAVTGIGRYDWHQIKDKGLIVTDFYAIKIITNDELNTKCELSGELTKCDGAKEDLLMQAHKEVLNALYCKGAKNVSIVVDDFTNETKRTNKNELRGILEKQLSGADVYLTTKGDGKIISVALASMISYYISYLGCEAAKEEFIRLCGKKNCKFPNGASLNEQAKIGEISFLDCVENISAEEFEKFMRTYAKRYYANVVKLMNN